MGKVYERTRQKSSNYIGMITLSPDIWIVLAAVSQLERELISERVRNGLANARAKGKQIGRIKKRNSVLIRSLLKAGMSFRQVSRLAACSHGSVSAEKSAMKKEELELAAKQIITSSPSIEIVPPSGPVEPNIIFIDVNPKAKENSPTVSLSSDQSRAA